MKLSRKKAIELCIKLWTWLARTGKKKSEWPEWGKYGAILDECWFCEYAEQRRNANKKSGSICVYCPYYKKIGKICFHSLYSNWTCASTIHTRKKHAKLFLKQIKKCK